MKLYLAAGIANGMLKGGKNYASFPTLRHIMDNLPYTLESYHYLKSANHERQWIFGRQPMFVDSGAFSAMTLGATIDINKYIAFLHKHIDLIHKDEDHYMASVLDAVGDAQKTKENQATMENNGFKPLPCFHYGEPIEYLKHYIENYDYITLGGMVVVGNTQLQHWLDYLWGNYLTDEKGQPRLKVHGFGMTSIELMKMYPWHSVDSSSWIQSASFGNVLMFVHNKLIAVNISKESDYKKKKFGHYTNQDEVEQQAIVDYLKEAGMTIDQLQSCYRHRRALNAYTYKRLGETIEPLFKREVEIWNLLNN